MALANHDAEANIASLAAVDIFQRIISDRNAEAAPVGRDGVSALGARVLRSFQKRVKRGEKDLSRDRLGFGNRVGQRLACKNEKQQSSCRAEIGENREEGANKAALSEGFGHTHGVQNSSDKKHCAKDMKDNGQGV